MCIAKFTLCSVQLRVIGMVSCGHRESHPSVLLYAVSYVVPVVCYDIYLYYNILFFTLLW